MAGKLSNETVLGHLRNGLAEFELVSFPVPSISCCKPQRPPSMFLTDNSHRFFARIGPPLGGVSSAMKKVERHAVQKVTGDGRCMFRALVKGMSFNKGITLNPQEERDDADELRMAVREVICDGDKEHLQYEEALVAITLEESLKRYCQRIGRSDFWGGESELLVLSKLCSQPIIVYIPEHEVVVQTFVSGMYKIRTVCSYIQFLVQSLVARAFTIVLTDGLFWINTVAVHLHGGRGSGFIPIAEYGAEFRKGSGKGKPRKVVRLLYSGKNHYDLLV
ncbi:unnamed protein product [Ilex paraguariensis]|uniref:Ubiquitin thioesterase OTU n=1 Tax=Ilex paraguariensis TaxID=185542 RepID=A0ABC8UFI2_9AQUA